MTKQYDIAIIGGGVVGCAIARELSKYNFNIVLIEKEADVAEGISKANSGVIHAGFNINSGTLKAKLNNEGVFMLPKLADELGLEYNICKKLVVAKNDEEKEYLEKLFYQGKKNNTPGLSIVDGDTIKNLEPHVNGKWALFSENTGVIAPYLVTIALAENALKNGVKFLLNTEVNNINKNSDGTFILGKNKKTICHSRWIINSAGIYSDKIAGILSPSPAKIYPCRGEYYILDKNAMNTMNMAIYPVPPKDGSGLGVHLTPTLNGNILIGPSADYISKKNDVGNTGKVMDILKKEAFELMPALKQYSFIKNFSGIRPKLFNAETGVNFADFHIAESDCTPHLINLIGIESPGLTSAPAIAKYVIEQIIAKKEDLTLNKTFDGSWKGITKTANLNFDEIRNLIETDPDYGELICRCEQITRKEILQAINNPLGVKTLNGIKKRTHSMMGRCQGGFCLSRISKILTDEYNLKPEEIVKSSPKSSLYYSHLP